MIGVGVAGFPDVVRLIIEDAGVGLIASGLLVTGSSGELSVV